MRVPDNMLGKEGIEYRFMGNEPEEMTWSEQSLRMKLQTPKQYHS